MRTSALALLAALGCGGAQKPAARAASSSAAAADTRSPIERRRDAACEQLGPKVTTCAVDDTRADFAAGKIDKAQLDKDTAPAVQSKNTEKFVDECKSHPYSSRQVRVLEVCFRQETQCGPLLDCLGHLSDKP